ncbi:IS4 family transposase [Streptomyces sp. M41(2017)]|uniref:IS4 family transposase n=1 Tax=Streptomyces sp. M41(2017) TaxID=1955065 RepID=UPI00117CADB2|nr:IS4 family transposase [Streptomyces sp. M41(2017)]
MTESITKNRQSVRTLRAMIERSCGAAQVPEGDDFAEEITHGWFNVVYRIRLRDGQRAVLKVAPPPTRRLNARLVHLCMPAGEGVRCLFARESYEEVLRVLTSGIPGSGALARVNRSSLCRARARLGEDVLETVFRQVAGPLATPATPGAWWRGLRLLALDGTQFDLPDSTSNGDTFDGPSATGGVPFGIPQVRAVVLAEVGTHGVLDARLGGYRDGERGLAYPLAGSTGPGDLVIADRGFWSVEFAHVFTMAGADLLVRLQSNHLGTVQEELPDGSYLSMARPGKEVRLRAAREGRSLPKYVIYRVITFAKDDKVAYLGTTLLDPEQHPAAELVALYRERWEIELAFDEIAVHHAIRQFARTAALARPAVDADRVSYLKCVRIVRRSIPSQLGATTAKLARSLTEAGREARSRLLPARRNRDCPRAIKKPNRWPVLRTRARRGTVQPGRWAHNPTSKAKSSRRAGRPALKGTQAVSPP